MGKQNNFCSARKQGKIILPFTPMTALENGIYAYLRYRYGVNKPRVYMQGFMNKLPAILALAIHTKGNKTYQCRLALDNLIKMGLVSFTFNAPDITREIFTVKEMPVNPT